jgi:O-methyltransferase involved in polyketide biosynthesis
MNKLKLEPAAALNMIWGKSAFKSDVLDKFISQLDLSAGNELYEECCTICDWYEEVVLNRKFFIENYISQKLISSNEEHLIIILAAGKSPLSLSLLNSHLQKINKVLEIDLSGMDEKKELYDRLFPEYSDKIKCITADISSKSMLMLLNSCLNEYYNNIPCIVILEGVACFLKKEDIKNIIASFRSEKRNNQLIVEYLLPAEVIAEEKRNIPTSIYSLIQENVGLTEINFYTNEIITELVTSNNGNLVELKNLNSIEKDRLGENKYFTKSNDSWIECSVWEL